ncbi:DNA polymerase alpha subunit A, partial [Phenoliferia sp. Uapishka_3]
MSSKADKRAAMEKLKAARAGGKREYEAKAEDIYDEVDDTDYRSIVRGRLGEQDFVEDDGNADGYADNGEENWDRSASEGEEEEAEAKRLRKKAKKEKAEAVATKKATSAAALKRKAKLPTIAPGANPYINPHRVVAAGKPVLQNDDDFMSGLLGDLDTSVAPIKAEAYRAPVARPVKKRVAVGARKSDFASSDGVSGPGFEDPFSEVKMEVPSSDAPMMHDEDDLGGMDSMDFDDYGGGGDDLELAGDVPQLPAVEEDDDEVFVKPALPTTTTKPKAPRQLVNGTAAKPLIPKPEPMEVEIDAVSSLPTPPPIASTSKPKGMDWRTATSSLAAAPVSLYTPVPESDDVDAENLLPTPDSLKRPAKKVAAAPIVMESVSALEDDQSLKFWWFDYVEAGRGTLVLIGKVKAKGGKDDGKWVSAVVNIQGIKRRLQVLPRAKGLDDEGNELDDDDPPEFDTVEDDFTSVAERYGVQGLDCGTEFVKRKYAFGIKGIPRGETDWIEATCDWPTDGKMDLPMDVSGERFSHVFGTNTSVFEIFVLDRKIMGPCWLNIANAKVSNKGISWTKLEIDAAKDDITVVEPPKDASAQMPAPPLTIMSISLRTVVHLTENKREVVCASTRVWADANIDDPTPLQNQPSTLTTLVRPLFTPFPTNFDKKCREAKRPGEQTLPLKDEKAILTQLVASIFRNDPDVIVGTDFSTLDLDVLLNRLKDLKVDHFSRVGRLRRPKWPKLLVGKNTGLLAGRLICDLSSDGSKAIIDSTTWSLTEMSLTHLKIAREDIDPDDTAKYFDNVHSTAEQLHHFVSHCAADCYLQMAVANKVQALPLSRQLTNLAGNSWNKTLGGGRAERNEFILLHRFNERGYVCPDKVASWEKKAQIEKETSAARKKKAKDLGEEEAKVVMTKEKFKGGLVFEPQKGLWDRFILVMDFNSLYPSIIQEYDIDFSTIDWTADDVDEVIRSPCDGVPQGILPQLIQSLVARRRTVKGLMKDKSITIAKRQQYDITQMALKLTANSMYGCLGYEGSRFYARPLAALTTLKGREILTRTKADAESINLDVIYGDTDSVMINTNETEYSAAIRIGNDFKKLINDKYKKLEIDTDAVFERMLLLAKKKYAARKVEEDGSTTLEVKGLDMKRREFSQVSKNASQYVLDQILSPKATEDVVDLIHEHLTALGQNVREGRIPLDDYIIFKKLGKNPQDYPDAKSQPHVTVALRMKAKGQSAKMGDVIPYIFCLPDGGAPQTSGKAANAYHPDDVRRAGSTLKIDYNVYLASQIMPPIERLCDPIEGTEKARLAECLGLDISRYKSNNEIPERDFKTLQSQVSDEERFRNTKAFSIRCRSCGVVCDFDGLSENSGRMLSSRGFVCSDDQCAQAIPLASIAVQLDLQIRGHIAKLYEGWLVCDDASCGNRTRMMSVYARRCLVHGCRGQMHYEYSDSMLYDQILSFDHLFDGEKTLTKLSGTAKHEEVSKLIEFNSVALAQLRTVVRNHLNKNGRSVYDTL